MDEMKRERTAPVIDRYFSMDGLELYKRHAEQKHYVIDLWVAFRIQWCMKFCSVTLNFPVVYSRGTFSRDSALSPGNSFVSYCSHHGLLSVLIFSLLVFGDQFWSFRRHDKARKMTSNFLTDSVLSFFLTKVIILQFKNDKCFFFLAW